MATVPHIPDPDDDDDNPADLPVEPDTGPGIPRIPDDPESERVINPRD